MAKRIQAVGKLLGNAQPPVPAAETFGTDKIIDRLVDEGKAVFKEDPNNILIPETYNREAIAYTEADEAFCELRDSIQKEGQDEPIHVRKTDKGIILISGRRRLEVCRVLGIEVSCIISSAITTEREAELEKYRENTLRNDLSAYELYRLWQSWLDSEIFKSKADIAKSLGRTRARVSQIFTLAKLPRFIVDEINDKRKLQTRHVKIYLQMKEAHENLDHTLRKRIKEYKAKESTTGKKLSDEKRLSLIFSSIRTVKERTITRPDSDEIVCVIKGSKDKPVFQLKRPLSEQAMQKIEEIIAQDSVKQD